MNQKDIFDLKTYYFAAHLKALQKLNTRRIHIKILINGRMPPSKTKKLHFFKLVALLEIL